MSQNIVQNIVTLYNNGLSIRQIVSELGFSVSKIRNILITQNVSIRSPRQGLILRKQNNFPLSKKITQRIEGELLGDGCIKKRTCQSLFAFYNSNYEYTYWLADLFKDERIKLVGNGVIKEHYYHKYWKKWYTRFGFSTWCSLQFEQLESRWYVDRKKIVPSDLEISPNLVLHWFLGDGSLPKKEYAIFCTDCFSLEEINFLSEKLNSSIGIKSSIIQKEKRIFIPKTSVPQLLEYIGPAPFSSIQYKWDLNPIGKINNYVDIPKELLLKLYIDENYNQTDLSNYFNCSRATIQKKLYEYQIYKRNSNKIFHIDKNKLLELYIEKNLTVSQTAKCLGCSAGLVKRLLKRNNIRKKKWRNL